MDHPDEDLPELQLSLRQFVTLAQHLYDPNGQDTDSFVRFILAGRWEGHRVFINARQGASAPSKGQYISRGDIDSVIGITRDLPFRVPLRVFPVPSFRDTLTDNNHITYNPSILSSSKKAAGVSLHKIPNMALGTADRQHVTRMFFPGLYKAGESPALSTETRQLIFECLRRAAVFVSPMDETRWPITHAIAMMLGRDVNGKLHFGAQSISAKKIKDFSAKLLELFDEHDVLTEAFFVHELRGLKSDYGLHPDDAQDRQDALDGAFRLFDSQSIREDQWCVDVAVEVCHKGHALQFLTRAHRRILRFLLPSASEGMISDILKSSTQYHCDLSAQLADIGGFRSLPGSRGKADGVFYINVYPTDKCGTYQLHEGLFRRRKPWNLFPSYIGRLVKDLKKISDIFLQYGGSDTCAGVESNARMEIRVPLRLANKVLLEMPDSVIQDTLVTFDLDTWWYFKFYRAAALHAVTKSLQCATSDIRLQSSSLALGAIVSYQINALIYRPAEGNAETALLEAACQHICADSENPAPHPIMYQRGTYFVSDLQNDGVYILPGVRTVDAKVLLVLYRRKSMADMEAEFDDPQTSSEDENEPRAYQRKSKKRKITQVVENSDGEADDPLHNANGCSANDDIPMVTSDANETRCLQEIIRQFPSDVMQLASNPNGLWELLLTPEERQHAKFEIFQSLELDQIFSHAQCRIMDGMQWEDLIFTRYFPSKGTPQPRNLQQFPSATYYRSWKKLIKDTDEQDVNATQEIILAWFNKLKWLPHPESDRMWSTKPAQSKAWIMVPQGTAPGNYPRVAINQRMCESEYLKKLRGMSQ